MDGSKTKVTIRPCLMLPTRLLLKAAGRSKIGERHYDWESNCSRLPSCLSSSYIGALRGLRQRHWDEISEVVTFAMERDQDITATFSPFDKHKVFHL
eukprot:5813125-Amphidinium_carterae.1